MCHSAKKSISSKSKSPAFEVLSEDKESIGTEDNLNSLIGSPEIEDTMNDTNTNLSSSDEEALATQSIESILTNSDDICKNNKRSDSNVNDHDISFEHIITGNIQPENVFLEDR